MENSLRMVGHYTAHAVESVATGDTLIPIVGELKNDGSYNMQRLMMDAPDAHAYGQRALEEPEADNQAVAWIKDGYMHQEVGKTDALIVDAVLETGTGHTIQIVVPYRHADSLEGFAVHRPKVTSITGPSEDPVSDLMAPFFEGIESHPQASKLWDDSYEDQPTPRSDNVTGDVPNLSASELETLTRAPFVVFLAVASAHGKVKSKEMAAFVNAMSAANELESPLMRHIVSNVANDLTGHLRSVSQGGYDLEKELSETARIIDQRLDENDANDVKSALLSIGLHVANASRNSLLGLGKRVSGKETNALAAIGYLLGVNA